MMRARRVAYTRELFYRLEAFFVALTGVQAHEFAPDGEFAAAIRALGRRMSDDRALAREIGEGRARAQDNLLELYKRDAARVPHAVALLGGTKLVLGGQQSFSRSAFEAVRSMALYADTVLIPDPVLRWFEIENEEAFSRVRMLEDVWWLLRLKPLVNAGLAVPPIVLFPSWEKLLEAKDEATRFGIDADVSRLFSHYLGARLDEFSEVLDFARAKPAELLTAVASTSCLSRSVARSVKISLRRFRGTARNSRGCGRRG